MNAAEILAALVAKLDETAGAEAGGQCVLASATLEMLSSGAISRIETGLQRKTRTLMFTAAEAFAADGARIATASAVHKIVERK